MRAERITPRAGRAAKYAGVAVRAFTIVEVIVVVVILGILVGAMAPRLAALTGREAQAAAGRVANLLSAAATRDLLTHQRIAVEFDGEASRLRLLVLSEDGEMWKEDPLTPAVNLGEVKVTRATMESAMLDAMNWRVEFPQDQPRPALLLVLSGGRGGDTYRVEIASRASRAVVRAGENPSAREVAELDGVVDLDARGMGEQAW
ncbi:hypothetical protein PHYC_03080 [Phycisphaerales bacterium]|nr:hypothetical protein PHYC_03080 [Phycisphaerales bacterium]